MKVRKIYEDNGHSVEFVKIERVPGFTHRVVIDGKAADWFSDLPDECGNRFFRVNESAAEFFLKKHFPILYANAA